MSAIPLCSGERLTRLHDARDRRRPARRRRAGAGDPVIVRGARSGPIENRFGPMRLAADWQRTDHGTMPEVPSTESAGSAHGQLPMMLMARAATTRIVTSETMLSSIINNFAREVIGRASVGLNAVAVQ